MGLLNIPLARCGQLPRQDATGCRADSQRGGHAANSTLADAPASRPVHSVRASASGTPMTIAIAEITRACHATGVRLPITASPSAPAGRPKSEVRRQHRSQRQPHRGLENDEDRDRCTQRAAGEHAGRSRRLRIAHRVRSSGEEALQGARGGNQLAQRLRAPLAGSGSAAFQFKSMSRAR
jgi:hypothetical protein